MTGTTDIFIRTYHKDLEWLKYCLRSIHKFVTGYRQIIICIPANEMDLLKPFNLTSERVVPGIVGKNGYILQQIDKLRAYLHTDAEFILFIDSDVCYKEPCNISEYFKDGKPIVFETPWEYLISDVVAGGDPSCWRDPTEAILGHVTDCERMRRLPFTFRADTLNAIDNAYQSLTFASLDVLSEFNLMGSFAKAYEADKYYFWDTIKNPNLPVSKLNQGWSWSGLTGGERNQMEEWLK